MYSDIHKMASTATNLDWWQIQCHAGALVFIPHEKNNNVKKVLTVGFFSVWATLTVGEAAGVFELQTLSYGVISALVFSIIAKQHDIELDRLQ